MLVEAFRSPRKGEERGEEKRKRKKRERGKKGGKVAPSSSPLFYARRKMDNGPPEGPTDGGQTELAFCSPTTKQLHNRSKMCM